MLKHRFTLRETVLVIVAAVLALGIFYYQVVYKKYEDALNLVNGSDVTEQLTILSAKAARMNSMEKYMDEHETKEMGEVAVYNNLSNEIDALADVLNNRVRGVSINWSEPVLSDTIVRRNADITFEAGSYAQAESIINDIADLKYRCVISSFSMTGADTQRVDASASVRTVMSVTFFETIDGASSTSGLIVQEKND